MRSCAGERQDHLLRQVHQPHTLADRGVLGLVLPEVLGDLDHPAGGGTIRDELATDAVFEVVQVLKIMKVVKVCHAVSCPVASYSTTLGRQPRLYFQFPGDLEGVGHAHAFLPGLRIDPTFGPATRTAVH